MASEDYESDYKISHVIETYKSLASIPSPVSATLLPSLNDKNTLWIHSTWNARDLIKSEQTSFSREYIAECSFEKFNILSCGVAHDTSMVARSSISKSGKRRAVLRKKGKSADDCMYLEIWSTSRKEFTYDMSDRKEHGKIYDNNSFGCLEWSADEKYLLYIAEVKQPKSESYFKAMTSQSLEDKLNEDIIKEEDCIFREDWGESLVGVHHSIICAMEVETGIIEVFPLEGRFSDTSVAQAVWGPNDEDIIFVGYKEFPRRLGLQYCTNRKYVLRKL